MTEAKPPADHPPPSPAPEDSDRRREEGGSSESGAQRRASGRLALGADTLRRATTDLVEGAENLTKELEELIYRANNVQGWMILGLVALVGLFFAVVDLSPDLSHARLSVLSGDPNGHYYQVVELLGAEAKEHKGALENLESEGSAQNLERLLSDDPPANFALVMSGQEWQVDRGLEVVARLPVAETVFFLGSEADALRGFADLHGMKIGVGPAGSGTARLARQIFEAPEFAGLGLTLENHSFSEQIDLAAGGALDLVVMVIDEEASLVLSAVRERGLQVAGFKHVDALAKRTPALRAGSLPAGCYDPVALVPPVDKPVLQVETLVVGNGRADRSDTVALLSLLDSTFPSLVHHNRETKNSSGLPMSQVAEDYYQEEGPGILDEHAPWLVNVMPLSNLIKAAMVLSILFNVMGGVNRFRLWRIDVNRVNLESELSEIFGPLATFQEIEERQPTASDRDPAKGQRLTGLIRELEKLKQLSRKQSVSVLVPMGQELAYRYQETLINQRLTALRSFQERLAA
jgi:uncharacterized protein